MRVLACHNYYQQPGGEDESFAQELALLEARGHAVSRFTVHNDAVRQMSGLEAAARTVWSRASYAAVRAQIRRERPDVMHCTNTFPLISPAAYYAARAEGVPVVQALRNYRLLCPNAYLMRRGAVCERCVGARVPWPGVVHACYRGSRAASAAVATMLAVHRAAGTWARLVDMYYALTRFARDKFVAGGLPADRIAVKPNFVFPDPAVGRGQGAYAVFVGRLSPEKGIDVLLRAWEALPADIPLRIVGDGPLAGAVQAAAAADPRISWLGHRSGAEVLALLGDAVCLLVPSLWYEGFPRTIAEAFARGTPVLGSRLGSTGEVIHDGVSGWHVRPGSAEDIVARLLALWDDPATRTRYRQAARRQYDERYAADANYEMLMDIYQRAITSAAARSARRGGRSIHLGAPARAGGGQA